MLGTQHFSGIPLRSPSGSPFQFTVRVATGSQNSGQSREFEIEELKDGNVLRKHVHTVLKPEYPYYVGFHRAFAAEFGTRPLMNKHLDPCSRTNVEYSVLLNENLQPEILYGYGDPAVLAVPDAHSSDGRPCYYVYSTSNDAPNSFPIIRSKDLKTWEFSGFIFPAGNKPEWCAEGENVADYWAPEVHKVGNEYRAYFVGRHKFSKDLCIGVARSNYPDREFRPDREPLLSGNKIDPHVFVHSDDEVYLFWKEDNNGIWPFLLNELFSTNPEYIVKIFPEDVQSQRTASLLSALWPWTRELEPMERFLVQQPLIEAVVDGFGKFFDTLTSLRSSERRGSVSDKLSALLTYLKTKVYAQRLSPDGSSLTGEIRSVLENDQPWEAHVIEGMWMTRHAARYYMFYSGNDFSTPDYGVGVAVADHPLGPFQKLPSPFLFTTPQWSAPGHASVAKRPDGTLIMFFHGYRPKSAGYKGFRALLAVALKIDPETTSVSAEELNDPGEKAA